ncbi:MAG: hypothetical protein KDD39_08165 [Bdellovibrionales bacterium]|nr:hypothetical protein [Bdellovibrionales bacterium]
MFESAISQSGLMPVMARAIVRENNDPDKKGRIRVEYPWFHGNSAEMPSEWARLCMPYASKESGSWFLPEIGDEVMVYFENGNVDFPIVMGALYNPKNTPPSSGRDGDHNDNNKNDLKFIRTRSGHMICFDDSDGNSGIVVSDKDNRRIELNGKDKKITISDEKDNHIEIEGPKISIKNSQGSHFTVDGSSIVVHSSSEIKLGESAAHALIKGDLFQSLFNSHVHGTAWGPSTPPMAPMTPAVLSQTSKTC